MHADMMSVLILPMRNGNHVGGGRLKAEEFTGSYPTYEEWKLLIVELT